MRNKRFLTVMYHVNSHVLRYSIHFSKFSCTKNEFFSGYSHDILSGNRLFFMAWTSIPFEHVVMVTWNFLGGIVPGRNVFADFHAEFDLD
jgi:hypothetical protein